MVTDFRFEVELPLARSVYGLELMGNDQGMQIAVVDDGITVNRVVIELVDEQPVVKVWPPGDWANREPAHTIPLTCDDEGE